MYNKEFAKIYNTDWSGFSKSLVDKILSLTKKRTALLDLGCGTGNFLQEVETEFENTVGIDISKDMIAIAKKNCKKTKFCVADISKFSLNQQFDLITCTYDTINHLSTLDDWQKMFCKVYEHLTKGGVFVFDFNTTHKMKKLNYSTKNISETENCKIEIENTKLDNNHVQMHFNIFNKSNKLVAEVCEIESFYSEKEIIQSLKNAGFCDLNLVDFNFNKITDFNISRIFVVCKKMGGQIKTSCPLTFVHFAKCAKKGFFKKINKNLLKIFSDMIKIKWGIKYENNNIRASRNRENNNL